MEKGTPVLLVKGLRISPNEVCDTHIEFFTRVFSCLVFHAWFSCWFEAGIMRGSQLAGVRTRRPLAVQRTED